MNTVKYMYDDTLENPSIRMLSFEILIRFLRMNIQRSSLRIYGMKNCYCVLYNTKDYSLCVCLSSKANTFLALSINKIH